MRLLPHPLLTISLTLLWAMLWNSFSAGTLAFGLIVGIIVPIATAPYWPGRPRLKYPARMAAYIAIVVWDILKASIVVAIAIVFRRNADLRPAWITVPLDLRTPEAVTVLAGTITLTPGTLTSDVSADGRSLLVNCLDAPDPDAVRAEIKSRYERRLKEIFE